MALSRVFYNSGLQPNVNSTYTALGYR